MALTGKENTNSNKGKTIIKLVVSLIVLAVILWMSGIEETLVTLSKANLIYLPLGVLVYVASQVISSYRWQFLAKALGFKLPLREFLDFYMLGMYFSLFLPGSIGGDVGRVYYLAKRTGRKKREALLTLLAERGVGLVGIMVIMGAVCLTPYADPLPSAVRWFFLLLALALFLGFLLLQVIPVDKLSRRFPDNGLVQLVVQSQVYWKNWPMLAASVALSFLVHGLMVLIHWLIAVGLDIQVEPVYLAVVYGAVMMLSIIPVFFNGLGIREGGYQYFLAKVGVLSATGLAFGLYWFAVSLLTSLLGGFVLIKGHYETPPKEFALDSGDADVSDSDS